GGLGWGRWRTRRRVDLTGGTHLPGRLAARRAQRDPVHIRVPRKCAMDDSRAAPELLGSQMKRREFIALLSSATAAWPLAARAQQRTVPVIGYLGARDAAGDASYVEAFQQRLGENGLILGQN